jgi:hypothetical protein
MAISKKSGNKFTFVALAMLIVVLVTAAFLPILPDSRCGEGARTTYLTLIKNEWNKRQKKPLTVCEQSS